MLKLVIFGAIPMMMLVYYFTLHIHFRIGFYLFHDQDGVFCKQVLSCIMAECFIPYFLFVQTLHFLLLINKQTNKSEKSRNKKSEYL